MTRRAGQRVLLVVAALLVAWTGQQVAAFGVAVHHQPGTGRYPVQLGSSQWLRSAAGGPRTWFRSTVDLSSAPTSAVLWLDADQAYTLWVGNHASDSEGNQPGLSDAKELSTHAAPTVHALDLTEALTRGSNVLAVSVTDTDGGAAALRAHLLVRYPDGRTLTVESTPSRWRATSDGTLVGGAPGQTPPFARVAGPGAGWPAAVESGMRRDDPSVVPQSVLQAPLTASVVGGARAADDVVVATSLRLTATPRSGWLRLGSRGSYALVVNGAVLAQQTQTPLTATGPHRLGAVRLFDVGRLLHAGTNTISVHVRDARSAGVYLDGELQTARGTVHLGTSGSWGAAAAPLTVPAPTVPAQPATVLGSAATLWPQGVTLAAVRIRHLPQAYGSHLPQAGAALALLVWAALGLTLAAVRRRPRVRVLCALAVGAAPAAAVVLVLRSLSRFTSRDGAFPDVPSMFVLLLVVAVAGTVLATLAVLASGRRADAVEQPPAADGAAVPQAAAVPVTSGPRRGRLVASLQSWGWPRWVIAATAVAAAGLNSAQLWREALWQDEIVSIIAAKSIRQHGLPRLPSGLYYFKGELYHVLLAVVGAVVSGPTALRLISIGWFVATILAFGLLLMPTLVPGRPVVHVCSTVLFAVAPMEIVWAHDVRMYQQMQFFAVVFFALFLRALTEGRRRQILGSAAALLAMYLSHEESFVLLPAVPLVLVAAWRLQWWRRREWYLGYGLAFLVIAVQYLAAQVHPTSFGQDLSNRSYVGWDPNQASFYYTNVFFRASTSGGTMALVSTLALVGGVVALARRDLLRSLAALALVTAVASMSLLFTVKIQRYTFVALPLVFALAGSGAAELLAGLRHLAGTRPRRTLLSTPATGLVWGTALPALLGLTLSLGSSPADFGLVAARVTDTTTGHQHVDYQRAAAYIRDHWRPGDVFVTLCPPDDPAYYLGRTPDRIIQTGRNKLLYLIERDGRATDTIYGAPVLLTGSDLTRYLQGHRRVWLVTDTTGYYLANTPPDLAAVVSRSFQLTMQGETSSVYLWTS